MPPIIKATVFTVINFALTIVISLIVAAIIKLIAITIHRSQNRASSNNAKKA